MTDTTSIIAIAAAIPPIIAIIRSPYSIMVLKPVTMAGTISFESTAIIELAALLIAEAMVSKLSDSSPLERLSVSSPTESVTS